MNEPKKFQTVFQYLQGLRPAIPTSSEKPPEQMSNSELRRLIEQGGVRINCERVMPQELVDFPVFSLVFFPSGNRRTTLV